MAREEETPAVSISERVRDVVKSVPLSADVLDLRSHIHVFRNENKIFTQPPYKNSVDSIPT